MCKLYDIGLTVLSRLSYGTLGLGVASAGASLLTGLAAGSSAHPRSCVTRACR